MNSALLLLLLTAVACFAAAQDTLNATETSAVADNAGSKIDEQKSESDEAKEPGTGAAAENSDDRNNTTAAPLESSTVVEAVLNTTTAETSTQPATEETIVSTTDAETTTQSSTDESNSESTTITVTEPSSNGHVHVTVDKDGTKHCTLDANGLHYEMISIPVTANNGETKEDEKTDPDTTKTGESSTVSGSESTTQEAAVEVTTQENEDSDKSTEAPQVEVTTQQNEDSTKSSEASSVELTTQEKEEESSTKSTEAPPVEVTTQKTGSDEESSTKSTKAPASVDADDKNEEKSGRRKREARLGGLITVEKDGAKETYTFVTDGMRYQFVIETIFVDPNLEDTQDEGNDNSDDILTENPENEGNVTVADSTGTTPKNPEAQGNVTVADSTGTTPKNLATPGEAEDGATKASTVATSTGKGNVTKSTSTTVAA